jgi:hypothetical protein
MERLEHIEYDAANERQNTVQPRAVNLAYAEPCPDEKSRRGSFHFGAVCARSARRWQAKGYYPQISPMTQILEFQICEIGVIRGSPWRCARRGEWGQVKGVCVMRIRFDNTQSDRGRGKWLHDFTRERHWVQGLGPASKMLNLFEDAQPFQQVSILEKPGDFFEGAHLFRRCARKLRTFERRTVRARGDGRRLVFPNIAEPWGDSYLERADPSSPIREWS